MKFTWLSIVLVCVSGFSGTTLARDARTEEGWTEYRNERFGFSLAYPGDLLHLEKKSEAGDGEVFVSRDGEARLLVGALPNDKRQTPAAYQQYIARQSYADYRIGYRRIAQSWFVLSGEGNGKTFYEKVMFSCGGRLINSFAVIYPTDQSDQFDRIVEGIEASFRPGRLCEEHVKAQPVVTPPSRAATLRHYRAPRGPRSALADRIARQRGHDVIVVLRRSSPPYDYRYLRGYASR